MINQDIKIVKVGADDLHALQSVSRQTFAETFSPHNSEEDMNKYLSEKLSLEVLTAEWNNEQSQFYFAYEGETVVGYLKLNIGDAQTEKQGDNALEVERIYVVGSSHGKNVGRLLFKKAEEIALDMKVDFIWLGVWEHNQLAIRFYEKNGLTVFDKHLFKLGSDEQTDLMMKKVLS